MKGQSAALLLTTAYFPPLKYFALIFNSPGVYIEKHENYTKQSYRNRCNILSANGLLPLIIPVKRFRGSKTPISDIKPDNSYSWQKLHLISIESAYRSAPFYEYYINDIRPFFEKKYNFLLDLNSEILEKLLSVLKIPAGWQFTSSFMHEVPPGMVDMRNRIHPKPAKQDKENIFNHEEYIQVFSVRHGFRQNLSILDLLFNTGPDAVSYLAGTA
jgi:hypothetical protein